MQEKVNIECVRYKDKENNPTCACNFETGEVCQFYRTQRFGCNETCLFASEINYRGLTEIIHRRGNGQGTLIPLENCPLWKE